MIARIVVCDNCDAVPHKALHAGLAARTTEGAASRAPHHRDSGFFYVHVLRMATRNAQIQPHAQRVQRAVWRSVWDTCKGVPVPSAGLPTRTDCPPPLAEWKADSQSVPKEPFMADVSAITVRPSAQHAHHGHITATHTDGFNRDVIAIANIENALQRVMYELKKVNPDMARAQKLTLAAMAAVQYVGALEVLQ